MSVSLNSRVQYSFILDSASAVDTAREVLRGMCYRVFPLANGHTAQMEICVGLSAGRDNLIVTADWWEDINPTLTALSEMGFSGTVEIYREKVEGCWAHETFMRKTNLRRF